LPHEILDQSKFLELAAGATECKIKRLKQSVKLKLRTKKTLYTIKLLPNEAEALLAKINCAKVEQ